MAQRARLLLAAADGMSNQRIVAMLRLPPSRYYFGGFAAQIARAPDPQNVDARPREKV